MSNPYLSAGRAAGSLPSGNPYLSSGRASSGPPSGNPYLSAGASAGSATPPKKSGGGLFGKIIGGITTGFDKTAHVAESIGTGLYAQGAAEYSALKSTATHPFISPQKFAETYQHPLRVVPGTSNTPQNVAFGKALRSSIDQTVTNPGGNPVNTALNIFAVVSLGAGAIARAGYAADAVRAARAGADARAATGAPRVFVAGPAGASETIPSEAAQYGNAAKAVLSPFHRPPIKPRFIQVPKLKLVPPAAGEGPAALEVAHEPVQLNASGGTIARAAQGLHDTLVQRSLDKNVLSGDQTLLGKYAAHRVAGSVGEGTRITSNIRAVPEKLLIRAGKSFDEGVSKKVGQLALFLRSANVTGDEAANYWRGQAAQGFKAAAKLADLAQQVHDNGLLHLGEDGNVQVAAEQYPKLGNADALTQQAQATREQIIGEHGLMTPEGMQNRLDLVASKVLGHDVVKLPGGGLGNRVPGTTSVYDLERQLAQSKTVLAGEQRKLATLEQNLTKPRSRPKLQAKIAQQRESVAEWQKQVAADEARLNTEGPRIDVGRRGQGYVPLKTSVKKAPLTPVAQARGPVIPGVRGFVGGKRATGSGVAKGLVPDNTTLGVARSLHEALRYQNTVDYRGRIAQFGSDVRQTGDDWLVRDPNISPGATKIPPEIEQLLGRSTSTLNTLDEQEHVSLARAIAAKFQEDFPGDNGAAIGTRAPQGYKWVPKQMIPAEITKSEEARSRIAKYVGDPINSAVTTATVYLKLGHFPTRSFTNATTSILQGSATPRQIGKTARLVGQLSEQEKRELAGITGTHGYAALPAQGETIIAKAARGGAGWWAQHIDAPFRINSILYEFRQIGIDTPEGVRTALAQLKDPTRRGMSAAKISQLDAAVRRANRSAIMYDGLSDTEKRYLTRYFWFYPWTKAAVRFAVHTVTEHPIKAAVGAGIANVGQQYQQQRLGPVPTFEYGLTPITGGSSPLTSNFSSFTPFSTIGQVAQVAAHPFNQDEGVFGQLNPAYSGLTALVRGKGLKAAAGEAVQPTPEAQVITAGLHPPSSTRMFGATNTGIPAGRRGKAALSALARSLGGTAVPRPTRKSALATAYAHQHEKHRTITIYNK